MEQPKIETLGEQPQEAHNSKLITYADDIALIHRYRRSLDEGLLILIKEAKCRALEIRIKLNI